MSTTTKDLDALTAEYRRKVAETRADNSLSWEKRERAIRKLGLAYDRARKELEEAA